MAPPLYPLRSNCINAFAENLLSQQSLCNSVNLVPIDYFHMRMTDGEQLCLLKAKQATSHEPHQLSSQAVHNNSSVSIWIVE